MKKILCIDDDTDICMLLEKFLSKKGYMVETAYSGISGLKKLKEKKFDLVLCDFRLPDFNGLEMIQKIKEEFPAVQVIIITGYSDVRMAVKAMKYGAHEYVTKPLYPEEILHSVEDALNYEHTKAEVLAEKGTGQRASQPKTKPQGYVTGKSQAALHVQKLVKLVAPTNMTVLLLGESGTGKEVTARMIHELSDRKGKSFVAVDCGALPKELASSELFGHKRGSFTGALTDKKGHFELADGGTLFLDEIGNLSYENQMKLLRVLQERRIRPLGDVKDLAVDVRVIAATNEDLKGLVRKGNFREDIYYRINEFSIQIPTLNERKADISLYLEYFLNLANAELGKDVPGYTEEAKDKLTEYHWPGNMREMKNVIKRAALLCQPGELIDVTVFPFEILNSHLTLENFDDGDDNSDDFIPGAHDLKTITDRAERKAILQALIKTGYNKSKTADLLKVDRKTLYNKMSSLGIDPKVG